MNFTLAPPPTFHASPTHRHRCSLPHSFPLTTTTSMCTHHMVSAATKPPRSTCNSTCNCASVHMFSCVFACVCVCVSVCVRVRACLCVTHIVYLLILCSCSIFVCVMGILQAKLQRSEQIVMRWIPPTNYNIFIQFDVFFQQFKDMYFFIFRPKFRDRDRL